MSANRFLDLIDKVDNVPLDFSAVSHEPYYGLFLSPSYKLPHGYIHPATLSKLKLPPTFTVSHDNRTVTLDGPLAGVSPTQHINAALQQVVDSAIEANTFPNLNKTHSEPFRILGATGEDDIVQLERFAAPLFGIATRGAHMTCYTRTEADGDLKIWVAKRSKHLYSHPGKLDSTVAGGVKASDSPTSCILAEAMEEASLPSSLVHRSAQATGVLTLANRNPKSGLFHSEILYVYDMELPADVVPSPGDDEVEEFVLMDVEEMKQRMVDGEFKPNVCPVMVDFLIRHGHVTADTEGEGMYVEICRRLRRRLPVPIRAGAS
ncbi:NUDIX hydrolase domain-like protein [Emericellopsis atlantica]|uniref:NUDIX hydrolase domain-like protein n=1 Tax=Emericellopsis atlantica TaxID=2614577 RepID=A0A9P7ZRS8_9HYPO|nr:NUDIX hydrolase domain-like protein [Emericellopsis atlantica]KAG9256626.1 NUDIX hydrolase domain-like protein [Emericellopsis atlantica]